MHGQQANLLGKILEDIKIKYYLEFPAGSGGNFLINGNKDIHNEYTSDHYFVNNRKKDYKLNEFIQRDLDIFKNKKFHHFVYGHSFPYAENDHYNISIEYYTIIKFYNYEAYVYSKLLKFIKAMNKSLIHRPLALLYYLQRTPEIPIIKNRERDFIWFIENDKYIPKIYRGINSLCVGYALSKLSGKVQNFDEFIENTINLEIIEQNYLKHSKLLYDLPSNIKYKHIVNYETFFLTRKDIKIFNRFFNEEKIIKYTNINYSYVVPMLKGKFKFIKDYLNNIGIL